MSRALGIPPKRALPSKESGLFKEVLNLYETRQLKKGLKTADQILKKFPEHGESICMKGLILVHMGRREEGIDLVKKGVRLDLTSHICWHVFGLVQKGEKNYEEALKSYTQALRFDKDNLNILRDAAHLQTQLRHYDQLVETRYTLLKLRPNFRQSWVALSVAHYLNGNLDEAKKVLNQYESTLKEVPDKDFEHSETLLYFIHLLEETGEYEEALRVLDANSRARAILDKTAVFETRARISTTLKHSGAKDAWIALLERNPESYDYYRGYLNYLGLSLEGNSPETLAVLQDLVAQYPKPTAPKRLSLSVATGETFSGLAEAYITQGLERGIPSLFADIKSLYKDESKKEAVEKIAEAARDKFATGEPTTYLWTLYFLAQHHSYLGRHKQALEIIDQAIEHTPTLPDLYLFKGRILKRAGDNLGAAKAMNEGRLLDGQDRFLNTKTGKYLLRAGMVEEASSIFGLFTKKDAASPGADLEDMQSLLYLTEEAQAHEQNGKPNLALKKWLAIRNVFEEMEDDQYDFHGYNLRKFIVNIYLRLLKWEDQLRSHPAYVKMAVAASRIIVSLHDDPALVKKLSTVAPLSAAEKKAQKKAKKAAAIKPVETKALTTTNEDKGLEVPQGKDEDPEGLKLIASPDLLDQAHKLLHPLVSLGADRIDVWVALYDVEVRRKKLLQAVSALLRAQKLDAAHPDLHLRIVDLKHRVAKSSQEIPSSIERAFNEAVEKLEPGKLDAATFNSQYLQRHAASAEAALACARALRVLEAPTEEVDNTIFAVLREPISVSIKTAQAALRFLQEISSSRADEFQAACNALFELSTVFKPAADLKALRATVLLKPEPANEEATL